MRRRSITASGWRTFPSIPHGSEDLLFFGRIHPDKGAAEAIAAARRAGRRLVMAGIVQDQDYHKRACRAGARRSFRRLSGPGRRDGPHENAGLGARAAPPHQFRGALRTVGRRGACLRHAGHRLQPRLDARADRAWRDRASWSTASTRPWRRSAVSARSIAQPAGQRSPRASRWTAWPIGTWTCTDRSSAASDALNLELTMGWSL